MPSQHDNDHWTTQPADIPADACPRADQRWNRLARQSDCDLLNLEIIDRWEYALLELPCLNVVLRTHIHVARL